MRARALLPLLLALLAGLLVRCFAPTYSDCAFRCSPEAPQCPDEYECHAGDGYCHLRGTDSACPGPDPGTPDQGVPVFPDGG